MGTKKGYSIRKNVLVKYEKDDSEFIIPDGVEVIGAQAFAWCNNLSSVTIPNSVKRIEPYAFRSCTNLTNVNFPDSIISIDAYAFYHCRSLASITIPNSVTKIGGYAFASCTSLTEINLPKSVTSLGGLPFADCKNITSITVESGNPQYHADGNCLISTDLKQIIFGCSNSIIPTDGSVTSIDGYAFKNCPKLTTLYIPSCVTDIGRMAFVDSKNLTIVTPAGSSAAIFAKDNKIPVEISFEKE